jgi:hypothetical protein
MAYNSYYMASVSYDTATTSLSVKVCEDIQRPVVDAILPKMGVNRNTARNVVFGTYKYGGLGLDHMAVVQGFAQLQNLIGSLRTHDTTVLEYTQVECDTATPILEADFARCEPTILTKNWITECWRFLSLCKSTVTMDTTIEGGTSLVDEFTTQGMTDAQMRDINRCRIYLQVFYTSDITDLKGNTLEKWAKQGKRQRNRTSKWN